MRKTVLGIFLLLFLFISCDPPSPGTLDCYSFWYDDSDISEGIEKIKIEGYLTVYHKNPILYIYVKDNISNLSDESYEIIKEYFSTIAISEYNLINRKIQIKFHLSCDYSIIYIVSAKNYKTKKRDFYTKVFDI